MKKVFMLYNPLAGSFKGEENLKSGKYDGSLKLIDTNNDAIFDSIVVTAFQTAVQYLPLFQRNVCWRRWCFQSDPRNGSQPGNGHTVR